MKTKGYEIPIEAWERKNTEASLGDLELVLHEDPEGEAWKETDYLVLDITSEQKHKCVVTVFFEDDHGNTLGVDTAIIPNRRVVWAFRLDELQSKQWFLPATPGTFKGHVRGNPTHIDRITSVRLHVQIGVNAKRFIIHRAYRSQTLPVMSVRGDKLIDIFGQRMDVDWPTKVRDEESLRLFLHKERAWAKEHNTYPFEDWDSYGGYKKLRFEATGYFYTKYADQRWWLVDPEGYAFFSNGICYGNRMGTFAQVQGIEELFTWLPDLQDPVYKEAWANIGVIPEFKKRNGLEACKDRNVFNFARANMIRAFAGEWKEAWTEISTARMKQWGFNTISVSVNNYDDEDPIAFVEKAKMPFTWALKEFPKTQYRIFRDFPDVFSKEYEEACDKFAEQIGFLKENPYLIGYFITNEPEWSVEPGIRLAEMLYADEKPSASKNVLLQYLKEHGEEASVEALMQEFTKILIQKYIQVPYDAIKKVDPNHLILGIRYAGITKERVTEADCICDVFSVNGYKRDPKVLCDIVQETLDMPMMITEWHFGGEGDRMYSNALINANGQRERGKACKSFMEDVMNHPQCIGAVYFELNDEPALGTYDGQALQDGLVDVCNIPYYQCVESMRKAAARMYPLKCGNVIKESIPWEYHERV